MSGDQFAAERTPAGAPWETYVGSCSAEIGELREESFEFEHKNSGV